MIINTNVRQKLNPEFVECIRAIYEDDADAPINVLSVEALPGVINDNNRTLNTVLQNLCATMLILNVHFGQWINETYHFGDSDSQYCECEDEGGIWVEFIKGGKPHYLRIQDIIDSHNTGEIDGFDWFTKKFVMLDDLGELNFDTTALYRELVEAYRLFNINAVSPKKGE